MPRQEAASPASQGFGINGGSGQTIRNNISVGHALDFTASNTGAVYSHNVCGAIDAAYGCAIASSASTLFENPGANNFHLKSGAPAINAGTDTSSVGVTNDFDNDARPLGGVYDIGADESGGSPSLAPAYLSYFDDPPAETQSGAPITPPIVVGIFDATGSVVTDSTLPITLALQQNPAGGRCCVGH